MEGAYKKSKGNAGLEGVQFQLDLLIIFVLNALRSCRDWRISSENEEASKYDDLVLEMPTKNVFLQAKFKHSKKITKDQLFSSNSKNADFSLAKYFFSYLEIRSKTKETTVIICSNTDINQKGLQDIITSHHVPSDSMLHYDGATCSYFTFNEKILLDLKNSAESYLDKNLKGKGFDKAIITDENLEEFLKNFQFFFNYPSGRDLHQVVERLLCRVGHLWKGTTYHEIYRKVEDWYKQPKGEYLTTSRAYAMLCEVRSDQYCNSLKKYHISFESSDFDFSNSNRVIHVRTKGGCLLQMLRVFQALPYDKAKQLYAHPKEDIEMLKQMVEAFGLPRYVFLIMIWPNIQDTILKMEVNDKLRKILEKDKYKKIVLLAEGDVDIAQLVELADTYFQLDDSVTFQDFSNDSREVLLKNKNIVFQGERVSLEELLGAGTAEDYTKSLDCRMLEKLVEGEEIKIGEPLLGLDEDIARYYVHRTFERRINDKRRTKDTILEENIFDVIENVILISDCAGMGKTTVLTKIGAYIKQQHSRMWVIQINLTDCTRILRSSLRNKKETVTLEELLNSQEATRLKNRFETCLFSIKGKIVLLMDGVDEIAPNYTRFILHLLRQCQDATNIVKVFATTRPHIIGELKAIFNVEPFTLLPFTRQNQIEFLVNYWTHNLQLKDADEKRRCSQYANTLIVKMSSWIHSYKDNSLVAIPLQIRMLAEIFQEKDMWESKWESCKEFLKGTEKGPKLPDKFDISKLCDIFIEKKSL